MKKNFRNSISTLNLLKNDTEVIIGGEVVKLMKC